nr:big defensin isoform X1 [Crassostrea gigas]
MKRKSFFCFFFIVLLISPAPILAETLEEMKDTRKKRQAEALLPLASYAGLTVGASVFLALVAAYGIYAVTKYAIKKAERVSDKDNHACGRDIGWCRPKCFPGEHLDWDDPLLCGSYYCCMPGRGRGSRGGSKGKQGSRRRGNLYYLEFSGRNVTSKTQSLLPCLSPTSF